MDKDLLGILIKDILIPEILIVFRAHQNAGLPPPTSEQVLAALSVDVTRYVGAADAFLARTAPKP